MASSSSGGPTCKSHDQPRRSRQQKIPDEYAYDKDDYVAIRYNSGAYPGTERIVQFKSFKNCKNGPPVLIAMHENVPKSYTLAHIVEHRLASVMEVAEQDEYDRAREHGVPASGTTSRAPSEADDQEEREEPDPIDEIHELKQVYEDKKTTATTDFRAEYDRKYNMPALNRQIAKKRRKAIELHEAIIEQLKSNL
jgi:acyl-CoA synthetase (NDP forming)